MHRRNPYAIAPPEFKALAEVVPEFQPYVRTRTKGNPTIDFQDPAALRALTVALLKKDFRLSVNLPEDRLCPAVPGRLDYVLFLQDLLLADRQQRDLCGIVNGPNINGLDIGVGASAIYPLLFARIEERVAMIGTDIDEGSRSAAQVNVNINQLENRIKVLKTNPEGNFFEHVLNHIERLDFTMCNPPFYSSDAEMQQLADDKEFAPYAVCTGSSNEMVTQGGETAFVLRMAQESHTPPIRDSISWFSTLLGKGSSVRTVVEKLVALGCQNYAAAEFLQGHTQRWAIAWSWGDIRLPDSVARQIPAGVLSKSLPASNILTYICPKGLTLEEAVRGVKMELENLSQLTFQPTEGGHLFVQAGAISWTRSARRATQRGEKLESKTDPVLCVTISVESYSTTGAQEARTRILCDWIRGYERQAFVSFFSHLVRKVTTNASLEAAFPKDLSHSS